MGMVDPAGYLAAHGWMLQLDGEITLTRTIPVLPRRMPAPRVDGETEDGLMYKIHKSGYRLANGEAVGRRSGAFQMMTAPWMTATASHKPPDARDGLAASDTAPDARNRLAAPSTRAPDGSNGLPAASTTAPAARDGLTAASTTAPDTSDGLVHLIRDIRANSLEAVHRALGTTPGEHLGYNYVVHWLRDPQEDGDGGEMAR